MFWWYFRSGLPNATNWRQDNLQVGVGAVLRFDKAED
jgi:hypothetical protein